MKYQIQSILVAAIFLSSLQSSAAMSCHELVFDSKVADQFRHEYSYFSNGGRVSAPGLRTIQELPSYESMARVQAEAKSSEDFAALISEYKQIFTLPGAKRINPNHAIKIILAARESGISDRILYQSQNDASDFYSKNSLSQFPSMRSVGPSVSEIVQFINYAKMLSISFEQLLTETKSMGQILDEDTNSWHSRGNLDNYGIMLKFMKVHMAYPQLGDTPSVALKNLVRYIAFKPRTQVETLRTYGKFALQEPKQYTTIKYLTLIGAAKAYKMHQEGKPMAGIQKILSAENEEINYLQSQIVYPSMN